MFATKELDAKYVDEALINSFNSLFEALTDTPIKTLEELVDQKLLLNICSEMDKSAFKTMKSTFMYDKAYGVFYAEIKEILGKLIELLKKTGIVFRSNFQRDFEPITVSSLIKYDKNELKKLVNLLVLSSFACSSKDIFIDRIASFDDFPQNELLKIVERYMAIDETSENIKSRNISNRNTLNFHASEVKEKDSNNLIESEFTAKFLTRIEYLDKEREMLEREKLDLQSKISHLESNLEKCDKERFELGNTVKDLECKITYLTNLNEESKKSLASLSSQFIQLEELSKEIKQIPELQGKLKLKDFECATLQETLKEKEELYQSDIKKLNQKIEILTENTSSITEMKKKFEKMKEMIKDYELMKEKMKYFEGMSKEFSKLKNSYESMKEEKEQLEKIITELEEKLEQNMKNLNFLKTTADDPEEKIDEYKYNKIIELENQVKDLTLQLKAKQEANANPIVPNTHEMEYLNTIKAKDETIKLNEETVTNLRGQIKSQATELDEIKEYYENELNKRVAEVDLFRKDNNETKDRYEKEFELMASAVYNLGLSFWSMKMEYTQKLNEKPNWLVKERQKYFNGDF